VCGIGGAIGLRDRDSARRIAESLVRSMRHRGPDSSGIELLPLAEGAYLALAHTRLSIIDLSDAASQPMRDAETGNVLVYNGEIYNFSELRAELEASGARFRSASDTEVLLKGYARWGREVLQRLRGMFAFAIWDAPRHELFLARDPFGIKPLYWRASPGGGLSFASEVRALVAAGLAPSELDTDGLRSYLAFGSVQAPWTMLAGVSSLMPGEWLAFRDGRVERGLSGPVSSPGGNAPGELVARVSSTLHESVKAHLVADVPVGVFLSGGIDSSVVTALATEVSPRVESFSIVFPELEYSEAEQSRAVASLYGTSHHEIVLSESDLLRMTPDALKAYDQPSCDGVNTYVVSRAAREAGLKVALSGLGGDELFAGYSSFARARAWRAVAALLDLFPSPIRRAAARSLEAFSPRTVASAKLAEVLGRAQGFLGIYLVKRKHWTSRQLELVLDREAMRGPVLHEAVAGALGDEARRLDAVNALSLLESRLYMANTLLRDSDAMGMANSLEIRVPFVDREVAALASSIPGREKLRGGHKRLVRSAPARELPERVWRRPKRGFELPFALWMKGALRERIDSTLSRADVPGLRREGVLEAWRQFLAGSRYFTWVRLWGLFVLCDWWERLKGRGA